MAFGGELIGKHDDLVFDLEQVKLETQKKTALSRSEQEEIDALPKKKRAAAKKEALAQKDNERKEHLRIWVQNVEDKAKNSGLPPEIVSRILEVTSYAKEHKMVFIYDIERKIEAIERDIERFKDEQKRKDEAAAKETSKAAMVVGVAVAGLAVATTLPQFVQVRYDKEKFEKQTVEYYDNKILSDLVIGKTDKAEPAPQYKTKAGSQYSQKHYKVKQAQQEEIQDIIAQDIQKKQKEAGQPVQDLETIKANFEQMHPVKKRAAERAILLKNPSLAKKHEAQNKQISDEEILRGIVRQERRKEEALLQNLEKQKALLMRSPRTPETTEQIANQILALEKRISTRREAAMALGLFMDNFERATSRNGVTASSLLKMAEVDGKVMPGAITDQITVLDMSGLTRRKDSPKTQVQENEERAQVNRQMQVTAQSKGLSAKIRQILEKTEEPADKKQLSDVQKEVEKRAQGLWTAKQTTKSLEQPEKKAAKKVIRPRINPKTEQEKQVADELKKIMADKIAQKPAEKGQEPALSKKDLAERQQRVTELAKKYFGTTQKQEAPNGGFKAVLAAKSEKRVQRQSIMLGKMAKDYSNAA